MSLRISGVILGFSLLGLFSYALFSGLEMPFRASLLPVLTSIAAIPLVILAMIIDARRAQKTGSQIDESSGDLAVSEAEVSTDAFRRVSWFFLWFAGLILAAHLFGFLIALPPMVVLYLLACKETLSTAILLAGMVLAILYWGFQKGLVLPLPRGILITLLFGN